MLQQMPDYSKDASRSVQFDCAHSTSKLDITISKTSNDSKRAAVRATLPDLQQLLTSAVST